MTNSNGQALVRNVALTALLSACSYATMARVLSPGIAIASTSTLLAHESGHVYSAHLRGAQPGAPIIVPLGIATLGITPVKNFSDLSPRAKRYVIASGPITGVATCLALLPLVAMGTISLAALVMVAISELYALTIGSDGSKIRNLKRATE